MKILNRSIVIALFTIFAAACSEKPQVIAQSGAQVARQDQRDEDQRRQRTLQQNESERIYGQGTLR